MTNQAKFEIYEVIDGMEMYRGSRPTFTEAAFVKAQKEAKGHKVKIVEFTELLTYCPQIREKDLIRR